MSDLDRLYREADDAAIELGRYLVKGGMPGSATWNLLYADFKAKSAAFQREIYAEMAEVDGTRPT